MTVTEPLSELVQTNLTTSAKQQLAEAAARRYVKPGTLLRIIIMEWLDTHEVETPIAS